MVSDDTLTQQSERLRKSLGATFEWSWDDRFGGLISQFDVNNQEAVLNALNAHFTDCWDQITIQSASETERSSAGVFCELRDGQLLFITPAGTHEDIMAAYWPWGDGKTVSLRIVPSRKAPSQSPSSSNG